MTKFFSLIGSLFLIYNTANGQLTDSLKYRSVGPAEFRKVLESDPGALLVDVREFFEYKKSRIDHAVNIPATANLSVSADTISRTTTLLLYCTTGFRSIRVARSFSEKGFTKVYSLDGGIKAWKKDGFPVNRKKLKKKNKSQN